MKKLTYLLIITLFGILTACNQTATNTDAANNAATDPVVATPTQEVPKTPSKSESIDTENNALIANAGESINKATITKGAIILYKNDENVHRIFGYEMPDVKSKRLLAVSAFTNDVEGNPHECELGAYYDLEEVDVKYLETAGDFVKAEASANGVTKVIYLENKWITKE